MEIHTFTGGIFDTNCFFIENEDYSILIDAPQESANWLEKTGRKVALLLLTHGHIDHICDASKIKETHNCQVACHPQTSPMITEKNFFRDFGFELETAPVTPDMLLQETESWEFHGINFQILEVPGHCPGSLCFLSKPDKILFGGDVLFAEGVGRWDLPGGDRDLLFGGIKLKLFTLEDDIKVLPGHGPATTIGHEKKYNPFIQ